MSQLLVDITAHALAIIKDPAHWTTDVYARNAGGIECSPIADAACCWCALGALQRSAAHHLGAGDPAWDAVDTITRYLLEAKGDFDDPTVASLEEQLAAYNDDQGHTAIVGLFTEALETMRSSSEVRHDQ